VETRIIGDHRVRGRFPSKVLAKIGSKHKKPNGLTVIPGRDIHLYLEKLPVEKVWGIGPNTAAFLRKHGIATALEFARKDERFIEQNLSKPYREIWHELNGRSVYPVVTEVKNTYQSISKAKTFTPPSQDETFIFAQVSKNLENACIKARRYKLAASRLVVFLRKQDFTGSGVEIKLTRPTAYPGELFSPLREGFQQLFLPRTLYRQTGVVLAGYRSRGRRAVIPCSTIRRGSKRWPGSMTAWTSCQEAGTRSSMQACPRTAGPARGRARDVPVRERKY
jgi:DNA polymerase-4/DNA polymerase V